MVIELEECQLIQQSSEDEFEDTPESYYKTQVAKFFQSQAPSNRTTLPYLKDPDQKISIAHILKNAIGKDLSRITMPVGINQPLGNLQAQAGNTEYYHLLEQAANAPNSLERMELVTTNMIAGLSIMERNMAKPFNGLLGETFELITPTYRYLAEQVSHHPPISAVYAKGKNFTMTGTVAT